MLDHAVADLTLPKMPYGTHQVPWDLRVLLYKGGAATHRGKVASLIETGAFGRMRQERVPVVEKLHEVIAAKLEMGISIASLVGQLGPLWRFVAWIDESNTLLTLETSSQAFISWTEALLQRIRVSKDLSSHAAYLNTQAVADLIGRAQDIQHSNPGAVLRRMTRMRAPNRKKRVLGTQADKQNLERAFEFGHLLAALCLGTGAAAVRGPLPLKIHLRDGRIVIVAGSLKHTSLDPSTIEERANREKAIRSRAALEDNVNVVDDLRRSRLLNLRVEAELLIFVAQTGMNLGQAAKLRRESYRWQTDGDSLKAFRVYKGRRGGEAMFHCFKSYRRHWEHYVAWLDATGLSEAHDGLFPFVYPGKIPASHTEPRFSAVRKIATGLGIEYFGPRSLRKTRINWVLRRSRDPNLTAVQAAHSKQTLLGSYEQPHHQSAAAELVRFHSATDPSFVPPGPGSCTDNTRNPVPVANMPVEAPLPDCISPEGCLFCIYHRDVMSADYCWKLASHARLKALEVSLYKPTEKNHIHPGNRVIDRINSKLYALGQGSDVRAQWVRDAQDAVRAGLYHPVWEGHIKLIEALV